MKKVLILTASIGSGHIRAAQAIAEALRQQNPADFVTVVDCTARENSRLSWSFKKIYLRLLSFLPNLYDIFYRLAGGETGGAVARTLFALSMYPSIGAMLDRFRPDIIVATHPFPAGAVAWQKKRGHTEAKLAVVLTDYSVHQIWLYREVSWYFTATEEMRRDLITHGVEPNIVRAAGIPVCAEVLKVPDSRTARDELNIPPDDYVILIMGGGLGLGKMEKTIDELDKIDLPLTILAVAGKNRHLFERLTAGMGMWRHRVTVWGYTNKVPLLMAGADILITKPGALTMSEALALGLPLALSEPIPGPEALNAKFAADNGAAVWLGADENIAATIADILTSPPKKAKMEKAALRLGRPRAAQDIAACLE